MGRYEWVLLELLVLGLAVYELVSIRRAVGRDRAAARAAIPDQLRP